MRPTRILLTFLLPCTTLAKSNWNKKSDAVKLSSIRSLTLRDGAYTSNRRVGAIPQLECVGGNAKGLYHVDVMQCYNTGGEYGAEDIQWSCKAQLPPEFKLGSTDVICEGYDSPDDPFVLKGSCGVEYRLILTPVGEEKYGLPQSGWKSGSDRGGRGDFGYDDSGGGKLATYVFWAFFLAVLGLIIYSVLYGSPSGNNDPGRRRPRTGGGGGNDDDDNDPPPPYTPRAPRIKFAFQRAASNSQPWRPGFWSGTAAGAAAGYAASAWANHNNTRSRYDAPQAGPSNWRGGRQETYAAPRPGPSSGWFGGGGGGGGGGPGPSSPSSSQHESTGFGGTRRR